MRDMLMDGGMMWGMGLVGWLLVLVLVLAIAALVKYVLQISAHRRRVYGQSAAGNRVLTGRPSYCSRLQAAAPGRCRLSHAERCWM